MTNTKDIIIKLKEVRTEKGLSYSDIIRTMEEKGIYPVSSATLSRVFAEGSEEINFSYETTIRPIAEALLDIEEIKDDDNMDIQAMKSLLKYKIQRMEELENQIKDMQTVHAEEKLRFYEKLDQERAEFSKRIDFLTNQIELKDKRIDLLLNAVFAKDQQHKEMLALILSCPARKESEECK